MNPILVNALELYAPNKQAAIEAHIGYMTRSITLDLMYDNIPGLQAAQLETKNYIYDKLHEIVKRLYKED